MKARQQRNSKNKNVVAPLDEVHPCVGVRARRLAFLRVALRALRAAGVFDEVGGLGLLRAGPNYSERVRVDQWECYQRSACSKSPVYATRRDFEPRRQL